LFTIRTGLLRNFSNVYRIALPVLELFYFDFLKEPSFSIALSVFDFTLKGIGIQPLLGIGTCFSNLSLIEFTFIGATS